VLFRSATDIQQLITIYQKVEPMTDISDRLDDCVIEKDGKVINSNKKIISKQNIIKELPSSEYCLLLLKRRLPIDNFGTKYYKKRTRFVTNPYLIIDNSKYQIIGCGLHTGSAYGGHYVYIGYDDNCIPAVTFNDHKIYRTISKEIEDINTDAMMFLYKRIGIASDIEKEAVVSLQSISAVSSVMNSYILQEIKTKIKQIEEKILELRKNKSSTHDIIGLNGFIDKAIQLYAQLSEEEKGHIGAFIPKEAISYLKIKIPDNLIR
jgi:hypothetical protein